MDGRQDMAVGSGLEVLIAVAAGSRHTHRSHFEQKQLSMKTSTEGSEPCESSADLQSESLGLA